MFHSIVVPLLLTKQLFLELCIALTYLYFLLYVIHIESITMMNVKENKKILHYNIQWLQDCLQRLQARDQVRR